MVMSLADVVPFGRSLDEYTKMFNLTESDLLVNILGVADGPASFNAELTAKGGKVTSIDPLYVFDASEIKNRFYDVLDKIIDQVKSTPKDWVWSYHGSPDGLRINRVNVTEAFVQDFVARKNSGSYIVGELPQLPLENNLFDLALCSHFLFLYSEHFTYEFHLDSIKEMLRVAKEVRIFPLLTLMLEKSPYIEPVELYFNSIGYSVEICRVGYELQKGGHDMMIVKRSF